MKNPHDIIIRPIISEQSMKLMESNNTYAFEVAKNSNKIEIRKAIQEIFNVEVENVNTMNMRGKKRRMGRTEGKKPDWKKAYVKLPEGENIEVVEGI
ncbi:MAG: 50S ribosomal protein L23 [Halanaerobiaceae bacterium]